MAELTSFAAKSGGDRKTKKYSFLLRHMSRAIVEEMEDIPTEFMGVYFAQMGNVVTWIGTGDNSALPPGIGEFLVARAGGLDEPLPGEDFTTPEHLLHDETAELVSGNE